LHNDKIIRLLPFLGYAGEMSNQRSSTRPDLSLMSISDRSVQSFFVKI